MTDPALAGAWLSDMAHVFRWTVILFAGFITAPFLGLGVAAFVNHALARRKYHRAGRGERRV